VDSESEDENIDQMKSSSVHQSPSKRVDEKIFN